MWPNVWHINYKDHSKAPQTNSFDFSLHNQALRNVQSAQYIDIYIYQSPLIFTELLQHNLINVSYLTACYLYQVMMTLHFLNDVANDAELTQKSKITS